VGLFWCIYVSFTYVDECAQHDDWWQRVWNDSISMCQVSPSRNNADWYSTWSSRLIYMCHSTDLYAWLASFYFLQTQPDARLFLEHFLSSVWCCIICACALFVFDVVLYVHHKSLILIRVIRLNFLMCDTSQCIRARRLDYYFAGIGVFYVVHAFLRYMCVHKFCAGLCWWVAGLSHPNVWHD